MSEKKNMQAASHRWKEKGNIIFMPVEVLWKEMSYKRIFSHFVA